jgi:hypothetical protein
MVIMKPGKTMERSNNNAHFIPTVWIYRGNPNISGMNRKLAIDENRSILSVKENQRK